MVPYVGDRDGLLYGSGLRLPAYSGLGFPMYGGYGYLDYYGHYGRANRFLSFAGYTYIDINSPLGRTLFDRDPAYYKYYRSPAIRAVFEQPLKPGEGSLPVDVYLQPAPGLFRCARGRPDAWGHRSRRGRARQGRQETAG